MIQKKKLVVVLPAYNAEQTLLQTYSELPHDIIDSTILVDDASRDNTAARAREMGISAVIQHPVNRGYGGNQKTCYREALKMGADIVVMVHPDYQYSPRLCGAIAWMIASEEYDVVLGSRIIGNDALQGGMPWWKYLANRGLTFIQNILIHQKLSEYHTGYRAFSRDVLQTLPLEENSDDFVFDNQMLAQAAFFGYRIGEISCPTRYMDEASSINFKRSVKYGFGVLGTSLLFRLNRWGLVKSLLFSAEGQRLSAE
nr:glycosyltransferase family 2 protein [Anaerolineae bacterium]